MVKSVASVFQQGYRDWRLILVDDGSTDKTQEIVERFIQIPNTKYQITKLYLN